MSSIGTGSTAPRTNDWGETAYLTTAAAEITGDGSKSQKRPGDQAQPTGEKPEEPSWDPDGSNWEERQRTAECRGQGFCFIERHKETAPTPVPWGDSQPPVGCAGKGTGEGHGSFLACGHRAAPGMAMESRKESLEGLNTTCSSVLGSTASAGSTLQPGTPRFPHFLHFLMAPC